MPVVVLPNSILVLPDPSDMTGAISSSQQTSAYSAKVTWVLDSALKPLPSPPPVYMFAVEVGNE
jgi:hypothetical protein